MSYIDGFKQFSHLIAYADGIDADTVAGTTLTFINGGDLENHIPFFYVLEWGSGTLGDAVINITAGGGLVAGAVPLSGLASTSRGCFSLLSQYIQSSGDIVVGITVPNGSVATFTIKVYGISL